MTMEIVITMQLLYDVDDSDDYDVDDSDNYDVDDYDADDSDDYGIEVMMIMMQK